MKYQDLCSEIFRIDPKIRGALVYHYSGELLAGGMREGVHSHLPREEVAKSTRHAILRWETRKSLSSFLGKGKYSLTEYQKVKRITFPLSSSLILFVSAEVDSNHDHIIKTVLQLIRKNFQDDSD